MVESEKQFDFIIAGGGCAGLSLAFQLAGMPDFASKKILIIERETKNQNDRTWCFWEKKPGPFESLIHHSWKLAWFKGPSFSKLLDLDPYEYKMIRADVFYSFVQNHLADKENITWLKANILDLWSEENRAVVKTSEGTFFAKQVFNSIPAKVEKKPGNHYLLQHFKGWLIQTKHPAFDPEQPTLMDFTIHQQGDCRFMYVLPTSPTEALVEYTIFSESTLDESAYNSEIENYIINYLKLREYEIISSETGIIPMFSAPFDKSKGKRIVNIGMAGGMTKASTGYTFTRIQRHSETLAKELSHGGLANTSQSGWNRRFQLYDNVLLHVLAKNIVGGAKIFENLFRYNKPASVFMFLDEDTHFLEEYRLINTVPILKFIGPGWKELLNLGK